MGKFEQTTAYYGAYYLGALIAAKKIIESYPPKAKGDDGIYTKAELELITRDKANMQKFLEGCHRIGFCNHVRNAKGILVSCEAYWVEEPKKEIALESSIADNKSHSTHCREYSLL